VEEYIGMFAKQGSFIIEMNSENKPPYAKENVKRA